MSSLSLNGADAETLLAPRVLDGRLSRIWVLSLLFPLGACLGGEAERVPAARVERSDLHVTLTVPGELKAVRSVSFSAPNVRGSLKLTYVAEEGKRVTRGDVLVEFDRTDLERDLDTALSKLRVAETRIGQLKAQQEVRLLSAENDITKARLGLERAQLRITESETVPRVERESARLDVQEYTLAVSRAEEAFQSAKLDSDAQIELQLIDAEDASARVRQARTALEQLKIVAPADGIVILVSAWRSGKQGKISIGDSVWPGNALMELPDLTEMMVEAWVHEVDASLARPDLPVKVVLDAAPEPPHVGAIDKVADLAIQRREESEARHLKLDIKLDKTDPVMKPGMSVRVEVGVETLPGVLTVPREAVFEREGKTLVYRQTLGGWSPVPVEIGKHNDSHVVVTSGLTEGDEVALVDPEATAKGEAPAAGAPSAP